MVAMAAVFTMALAIGSAPEGVLVLPDATPTAVATLLPTTVVAVRDVVTVRPLPTRLPVMPAVTPAAQLVDLNFATTGMLATLGLSPGQAREIFILRCTPAESPYIPYPAELDGCGSNAAGIVRLQQIVDAGILTEEEVVDHLVGRVVQTWD